jgi:F-type H+-transporting ATPase subunit b
MEIISTVALITINETLIIQLVSFLVFLYFFNRIMIKPLRGTVNDRQRHMSTVQAEIATANKTYDDLLVQIDRQESEVKHEAQALHQALEQKGSEEAAQIFSQARQAVAERKKEVRQMIDRKIAEAKQTLETEAETLSTRIMENILDRSIGS